MIEATRQWAGEVETGSFGIRVGGEDLNLAEVLEAGDNVRITIELHDAPVGDLHRIMARVTGTLPPREPAAEKTSEDVGTA